MSIAEKYLQLSVNICKYKLNTCLNRFSWFWGGLQSNSNFNLDRKSNKNQKNRKFRKAPENKKNRKFREKSTKQYRKFIENQKTENSEKHSKTKQSENLLKLETD